MKIHAFLLLTSLLAAPLLAQTAAVVPSGDAAGNFGDRLIAAGPGSGVVGVRLGTTRQPERLETPAGAVPTPIYRGFGVSGDSNTVCYQFAAVDARHCAFLWAAQKETGTARLLYQGYGGTNILDYTWFEEMYNQINPGATGNPIRHLMIGTNTVRLLRPNAPVPAAWLTAASQEMYAMAIHQATPPQDKYLPGDAAHATTTGVWSPTFNFVAIAGPIDKGCGYRPGDTIEIGGTPFAMTVDTVLSSPCAGAIEFSHVSTFATPPYDADAQPTATTALTGSGFGATYEPLYQNKVNDTLISRSASTDAIHYADIPVERGCVFLNYEVWPAMGLPGGAQAASLSVYADDSKTPMTDVLTGLTTISGQISDSEPGTGQNKMLGGFNGWKVAKLCGLRNGTHGFDIRKNSTGIAGIQYLASPGGGPGESLDGPYLNVVGIVPIYPAGSSGLEAAIASYNQAYSTMVRDLGGNFGLRIVYTDSSSVDMSRDYYVAIGNQYWGRVVDCGIRDGVVTMTETYSAQQNKNLPAVGQGIEASNLKNCGVANGVPLVVQSTRGTLASATITATPEYPSSSSGGAVADSNIAVGVEPALAVTEITMDGWIPNASSANTGGEQLHMPQNAQMDLALRLTQADAHLPGSPVPLTQF